MKQTKKSKKQGLVKPASTYPNDWDVTVTNFCHQVQEPLKDPENKLLLLCGFRDGNKKCSRFTARTLYDLQNHMFEWHVEQFFVNIREHHTTLENFIALCKRILETEIIETWKNEQVQICPLQCSEKQRFENWSNLKKHIVISHYHVICRALRQRQMPESPSSMLKIEGEIDIWQCVMNCLTVKHVNIPASLYCPLCIQSKTILVFLTVAEMNLHIYTKHLTEFFRHLKDPNLQEKEFEELCSTWAEMEVYEAEESNTDKKYLCCTLTPCAKTFLESKLLIVHLIGKHYTDACSKIELMQSFELKLRNCENVT